MYINEFNLHTFECWLLGQTDVRSLVYNAKSKGRKIDPCGTPVSEFCPDTLFVLCLLSSVSTWLCLPYLQPPTCIGLLFSCGVLSCLCVVIEFLSWPAPVTGSPCLVLGPLQSLQSTSIWALLYGAWLGLFHLPGLAASSAAILPVDVQAIPVVFPSCLSVSCILVVESHANLTTLLYLCFVINPWHSLTLQLGPPSPSLTHQWIYLGELTYNSVY